MAKPFDPKAKAKKQKILLAVLGVVLAGVLVYQAPTIFGAFGGSSTEVASEPAPAAPVPVSAAPAATAPAASGSAQLVDSDVPPEPAEGQLVSFDRFESKDPFAQQAEEQTAATTAPAPTAAPAPRASGDAQPPERNVQVVPQPAQRPAVRRASTATITVNGEASDVAVGGAFPEGAPIFRLVSLRKGTAKIGIVDGTYASGSATITLKKGGKPVTLMNTAEGTTYVLRLVSVG